MEQWKIYIIMAIKWKQIYINQSILWRGRKNIYWTSYLCSKSSRAALGRLLTVPTSKSVVKINCFDECQGEKALIYVFFVFISKITQNVATLHFSSSVVLKYSSPRTHFLE